MDINQLRVLNDYLNQTIDVLARQPWGAYNTAYSSPIAGGLSHSSPYTPFGMSPMGIHPYTQYSPFAAMQSFAPHFAQAAIVDPFIAARGLSHSPFGTPFAGTPWASANPWTTVGLGSEIARQNQLTQVVAARQQVLEALCRAAGIPV